MTADAGTSASPDATRRAPRCAVTRGERVGRAAASIFVGAFSLSMLDNPWCAIPAGACAVLLMVGAITGWCPSDLLRPREATRVTNASTVPDHPVPDYPVAPDPVRLR
jgi:hypothetical protein